MAKGKTFLFLLLGLLLINFTSAFFEFDNYYTYDERTRTASFKNGLTFGSSIGQVKLNTPLDMEVAPGYNYVFEVEIWGDVDYSDFIKDMYVHDRNSSYDIVDTNIDLKYFNGYETKFRDIRGCLSEVVLKNGTTQCEEEGILEVQEYQVEVWDELSEKNLRTNDHLVVRGYTNVGMDDKMEWYIDFFGAGENTGYGTKGVKEWASWTASLNVDIISFWKFNSTSGVVLDSLNVNNGTNNGATRGAVGIINASFDYDGIGDFVNVSNGTFNGLSEFTISYWINPDDVGTGLRRVFRDENIFFTGYDNGLLAMFADTTNVDVVLSVAITHSVGTWVHVVATYNDSLSILYEDGAQVTNASANGMVLNSNGIATFGSRDGSSQFWDGRIDEVGFWERALTPAEVQQLYNGGSGITFTSDFNVIQVTLNEPLNDTQQTDTLVEFNWTITPTSVNITNWTLSVFFDNGTLLLQEINTTINTNLTTIVLHNETIADGDYIWNVESCGTDIGDVCDLSENRTFSIDVSLPSITVESPVGTLGYNLIGGNETLNATFTDSALDTCWFDYNGTNVTINGCVSGVKNSTLFILEDNNFNMTLYANDTLGNENSTFIEWSYALLQRSITFSPNVTEGEINQISIKVLINGTSSITNASLTYDGANLTTSTIFDGENFTIVSNNAAPIVSTDTNLSFSFFISVEGSEFETQSNNQTVLNLEFEICGGISNDTLLNMSLFNEETLEDLIGDIEFNANIISKSSGEIIATSNETVNDTHSAAICFSPVSSYSLYLLDAEIRYSKDGFTAEFYNIQKADMANFPINLSLFPLNQNDSTEFAVTYKNNNFIFTEGAVIQLQRKYIGENVFRVVEAPTTGDGGQTTLHIDLNTNRYRISVVKEGVLLDFFENVVFNCENVLSGDCTHNLIGTVDPNNDVPIEQITDFAYTITVDEGNQTITVLFAVPSGTPSTVNVFLNQIDMFGNSTSCNTTVITSAGSITCGFNDTIEKSILELSISKNSVQLAIKSFVNDPELDMDGMNFFIVFMFMISLVGMAIASPEWIILISVMVVLISGTMLLLSGMSLVMGLGAIAWVVIAAAIIIMKMSKQEDR